MPPESGAPFRTLMVRISAEDIVLYANRAAATYLGVTKAELIGAPLEVLAARARGEVAECFARPENRGAANRLVTDADGRVFELKTASEGGVLDIVLDEVTTAESVSGELRSVSGTPVEVLDEEELRTARQPERRFLSVSVSRMDGLAHAAERLPPMETRLMVNSFVEEVSDAILETGCTVQQASGGAVLGIFGAPRYFADHALRAVRAACNQTERFSELRGGFFRQGKELLPVSCGIWTGEVVVGTVGSSHARQYGAIGQTPDLAERLSALARPGETLVCEFTVQALVRTLPDSWQAVRANSDADPDLSDFAWSGNDVVPLDEAFIRGVWLVGPDIQGDTSRVEYYFEYLWSLEVPGHDAAVPILRVVRPAGVGDSIELNDDNVIATRFTQSLGKYKLQSVIGTGGMGKVWRAQDRYGNTVAIKVLHASETASEAQLKRFRREAEVMARLPHRNICRVFEMSEFESIHYIVMEFVDGLTLADLLYAPRRESDATQSPDLPTLIREIKQTGEPQNGERDYEEAPAPVRTLTRVLPVEQTLTVVLKICEAVQFAHEHGVLHRDLKPGNILLREDGEPLVADFGLAKLGGDASGASLSVTGNVVGTLENMAPEQAESSKDVDERADVYALGTILFQMLTGHRHFAASGNIVADAQALQNHEPVRPRSLNAKLDTDLELVVLKALRNSPAERYRSVSALKADLERYRNGEPISAKPVSAVELFRKLIQRNRPVSLAIAISLFLLLIVSVAAFWQIADRAAVAENARLAAEKALDEARSQRESAMRSERLAQEQKREAEQRRREALDSLAKMEQAQAAAKQAHQTAAGALEQSAAAVAARKQADAALRAAEERARSTEERMAALLEEQTRTEVPAEALEPLPAADDHESRRAFFEGLERFMTDFAPMEMGRLERSPEEVARRIGNGLAVVSRGLLAHPDSGPLWTLKGYYHLSGLELGPAADSFEIARRHLEDQPNQQLGPMSDPSALLQVARDFAGPGIDRFSKMATALGAQGSLVDRISAGVVRFFAAKPQTTRSTIGQSPIGRRPGPEETAVDFLAHNGGVARLKLEDGRLHVEGLASVVALGDLRALELRSLSITGASEMDWSGLATLNLDELDLAGSRLTEMPASARLVPRVRVLSIKGNDVPDVGFVRWIPGLESLDVSDTWITDLSPLTTNRRLRKLDVSGLRLENIRVLSLLPLEELTISPGLVFDAEGLQALRGHRTLRILRGPDDPAAQTAAEFWKRFDTGDYTSAF